MSKARTNDVSSDDDPIPPLIDGRRINISIDDEDHEPISPSIHERRIDISSIDDEDHVEEDHERQTDISLDDDEDLELIN